MQAKETFDGENAAFKTSLDHSWAWFSLHAGQRMQLINFFFVASAFVTAAFATTVGSRNYVVSSAIALMGAAFSVAFNRLDMRTRELVRIAEAALAQIEERLIDSTGIHELHFVELISKPSQSRTSYGEVVRAVTTFATVAYLAGFLYAVAHAASGK